MAIGNYPPISPGTIVRTTQPNLAKRRDWTKEGWAARKWGVVGVVMSHSDSHGLCYEVRHDNDKSRAYYNPEEIAIVSEPPERKIEAGICDACDGSGYNPATKELCDSFWGEGGWHGQITQDEVEALLARGRLIDFTHRPAGNGKWIRREDKHTPTAEEVNAAERDQRAAREAMPLWMGHDDINRMIIVATRASRLGIFGLCPKCHGTGESRYSHE